MTAFIVAPDPLFVDPITGKCGKLTIFDTETKWTQKFGIACFRNWADAFDFIHHSNSFVSK